MKKIFILKSAILLVFLISFGFFAKAQVFIENPLKKDSTAITSGDNKNIFLEIGGPGLAFSLNFDARFGQYGNGWGYRIGGGYFARGGNSVVTVPFQFNYLFGTGSNLFEIGEGATFLNSKGSTHDSFFQFDNITGFIGTATIGYRYQPKHAGINFRIAFVPIFYDEGIIPIGGISVGYTF